MQEQSIMKLSRRMSFALRHRPDAFELTMDAAGWVLIEELLAALGRPGRPVTRAMLDEVVTRNDKQRFAVDASGTRIRASQGHSVDIELGLRPVVPPDVLYHGTVERFLPEILREGLRPMRRHHVHLSSDVETARKVGARRGEPVVLSVDAAALASEGTQFYRSDNGVWLVDAVPPRHLSLH